MATTKPNICGNEELYVPDDDCGCCEILTQKVEEIEDTLEEHDARITANKKNFANYYDKQTIDAMIGGGGGGGGMRAVVVDELPEVGDPNTFYYVLSNDNALVGSAIVGTSQVGEQGKYEKWLYSNGQWHNIGADHIDFENYVSTTGAIKEYDEKTLKVPQPDGTKLNMKFLGKGDMEEVDLATLVENRINTVMANYCPYKVGDIMFTATATNPSTRYPNTQWSQIQGKFIFGQDSSHALNSTGGSKDAMLPQHRHTIDGRTDENSHCHSPYGNNTHFMFRNSNKGDSQRHRVAGSGSTWYGWVADDVDALSSATVTAHNAHRHALEATCSVVGGNATNANMPPYITKYIWQRTR